MYMIRYHRFFVLLLSAMEIKRIELLQILSYYMIVTNVSH